eukprot:3270833-Rhodomonas_salina.3
MAQPESPEGSGEDIGYRHTCPKLRMPGTLSGTSPGLIQAHSSAPHLGPIQPLSFTVSYIHRPAPRPVLTQAFAYAVSRTKIGTLLHNVSLRPFYPVSGTDLAYAATRPIQIDARPPTRSDLSTPALWDASD